MALFTRKRAFGIAPILLTLAIALHACGGSEGIDPDFGIVDYLDAPGDVRARPGDFAPNFRLELAGGGEIELAEELGMPILLNFFASWCTNCVEEMNALNAVDGRGVKVIGIDFQEEEGKVLDLAEETGATFPMALDRTGKVSREYRATSLPVTLLLDSNGMVIEYFKGPVTETMLAEILVGLESSVNS